MQNGGFDVVIGNPPYVEYSKVRGEYIVKDYLTEKCGNLHSYIIERCTYLLHHTSFSGLIVPHSIAATYRMQPIQEILLKKLVSKYSYFSRRPGKLFEGADQCLCIVIGTPITLDYEDVQKNVSTTYQRWYTEERDSLFGKMHYLSVELEKYWKIFHVFPKLGTEIEETLLSKMIKHRSLGLSLRSSGAEFYCHRISRYFIKSTNFIPYFCSERDGIKRSDDFKVYKAENVKSAILSVAVLNSSLFYWFWRVMFDGYHCGKDNISVFPFEPSNVPPQFASQLENLTEQLMISFQKNAVRKTVKYKGSGSVEYDEFSVKHSKPIIDEIDRILAQHYGFTPEELDFIINYDIKYRMGRDSGEESEE